MTFVKETTSLDLLKEITSFAMKPIALMFCLTGLRIAQSTPGNGSPLTYRLQGKMPSLLKLNLHDLYTLKKPWMVPLNIDYSR